jgi:tryptophan synthase alpha chain
MSRIGDRFARCRQDGRKAFVGFVTAGDPSLERTASAVREMEAAGVDVLELGVPFSDPLADGPVIQRASDRALRRGTTLARVLELVHVLRRSSDLPLLLFTDYNPVARYGLERLARDARSAGVDGVLVTDLPPEEAGDWLAAVDAHGLDPVFLVAPSSTDERIDLVARTNRGFIYAASTMGVTGTREAVSDLAPKLVARVKAATDLPVAVGLGVSDADQAAEIAGYADGVVVGSAFVRRLLDGGGPDAVRDLAGRLAEGVRRPRR